MENIKEITEIKIGPTAFIRPTLTRALYDQMIGRVKRSFEEKDSD